MNRPLPDQAGDGAPRGRLAPLYAAGFITAFGAHEVRSQ